MELPGTFWSLVWAALRCHIMILVLLVCLAESGGVQFTLTRGGSNPPDEFVEVSEGEVLTLNCSVSHPNDQMSIRWLKGRPSSEITDRVYLDVTQNNYSVYNLHISNVTVADYGKYTCGITWKTMDYNYLWGRVYVIPRASPICSTNTSEVNQTAWCDSWRGYPDVTLRWTEESTSEELDGTLEHYTDETGRERVRSVLQLPRLTQPYRNLVCMVTSEKFPGLNKTCNISLPAWIEQSPTPSLPQTMTDARATTNTHATTDARATADARGSPGINAATVVPAVVVPLLLIIFSIALICLCVLKQKRQDRDHEDVNYDIPERNLAMDTINNGINGSVVVPYSVTTLGARAIEGTADGPNRSAGRSRTGRLDGQNMPDAPYDVLPELAAAAHTVMPELTETKNGQKPKGHYYSLPPDAGGEVGPISNSTPEDICPYEHVNTPAVCNHVEDVLGNAPKAEAPPNELHLNPAGRSVSYTGQQVLNATGDVKGQLQKPDVPYYTTPVEDNDTNDRSRHAAIQLDSSVYERVNLATTVKDATKKTPSKSRTARTLKRFAAKLKPAKQTRSPADKQVDEGLMVNPIYQPLDRDSPMIGKEPVVNSGEEFKLQPVENHGYMEIT